MLNAREAEALREACAPYPAAIYIPTTGEIFTCPNTAAGLHQCPRAYTVATAERHAKWAATVGVRAVVLAYGIPWSGT